MKKIIILLVSALLFSSCAAQGYKDQRGIIRMLYGGDTLSMMFSGDTNLFTGNLQYFKLDGGIIIDSFKLGSVWYSSLLTPPSSVDLSDAPGGSLLFELNDTIGWHSGLGALNGKIFSLGIESTSTTGNLLETSADTNILRNTATNGVNLLEATATGGTNRMSAKYRNEFWADDTMRIYIDADGLHGYSIPESPTEAKNGILIDGDTIKLDNAGTEFNENIDIYTNQDIFFGANGTLNIDLDTGNLRFQFSADSFYTPVPIKGNHGITGTEYTFTDGLNEEDGVVSYDGVVYDNYTQLVSMESEGERRNAGFWADFNESGYGKTAMFAQGTKNTNELDLVLDTTGAYFEGITLNSDNWTDDHLVTKGYVDSIKTIINMNSDGSGYAHIFSDDAIQFYVYDAGGAKPGAIELDNVNGNFSVLARGNNIMSVRNIVKGINIKTLSGSLTDGAPTSAEITSIVGYAANNSLTGKGYQVTIKDTDGSGLLYKVESDGTDWYYTVMTKAL